MAVACLIPLDFVLLPLFPERGTEGRSLFWFLVLIFLESVFVAVVARPDQPLPSFLDFAFLRPSNSRVPQTAVILFVGALAWLLVRLVQAGAVMDYAPSRQESLPALFRKR